MLPCRAAPRARRTGVSSLSASPTRTARSSCTHPSSSPWGLSGLPFRAEAKPTDVTGSLWHRAWHLHPSLGTGTGTGCSHPSSPSVRHSRSPLPADVLVAMGDAGDCPHRFRHTCRGNLLHTQSLLPWGHSCTSYRTLSLSST